MKVKEKAYYYWLWKFREEACAQMQLPIAATKAEVTFAEVIMPIPAATTTHKAPDGLPGAVIKYNRLAIELSNDISEVLLSRVLKEVTNA